MTLLMAFSGNGSAVARVLPPLLFLMCALVPPASIGSSRRLWPDLILDFPACSIKRLKKNQNKTKKQNKQKNPRGVIITRLQNGELSLELSIGEKLLEFGVIRFKRPRMF